MIQIPISIPVDLTAKGQIVCGGRQGEDGFRELVISIADELKTSDIDYYVLNFISGSNAKTSDKLTLESDGCLHYPLPESITDNNIVTVDISAFDMNGSEVVRQGRSPLLTLTFEPSNNVDGAEIIDGVEKGIVEQAFEIADKFGETPDGQPTYNGEPITADTSNFLAKDNTEEFIPTADYNPATKKYVDDNAGGGGIDIVATVNDLPVSPTEGDLLYLKATGKFITNIPKTSLSGVLYSDNDLNGKIYPKLFFNPSPNTDGLPMFTDTCLSIFAGVPESITVDGMGNFYGVGVQIQCMHISDFDETYAGTESIVFVMIMDDINETEEDYLFTHQDVTFLMEDEATIDAAAGWNQLIVRVVGTEDGKDVYEYLTIPCDEPPALKSAIIYRSEWDDGDYDGALAALAEFLQPNPYYIVLPSGVIGHFDGLWQPQDYPSNREFEKTVEKIKHTYKSETDLLKEDVSNLKTDSHKHQNKVLLDSIQCLDESTPGTGTNQKNFYSRDFLMFNRTCNSQVALQRVQNLWLEKINEDTYSLKTVLATLDRYNFRASLSTCFTLKFADDTIYNCRLPDAVPGYYQDVKAVSIPMGFFAPDGSHLDANVTTYLNYLRYGYNPDNYYNGDEFVIAVISRDYSLPGENSLFSKLDELFANGVMAYMSYSMPPQFRMVTGYHNIYNNDILLLSNQITVALGTTVLDCGGGYDLGLSNSNKLDKSDKFVIAYGDGFTLNTYYATT